VFRYLWSCNQTSSGLFPHIGWWQASYKGGRTWVSCSGSWESSRKMYHSVLVIMILRSLKSSQVFLSFAIFLKQLTKVLWWPDHGHLNRSIWSEQPTSSWCWVKVYNLRLLSVNTCSHPTGFAAVCWRGTRPQHHLCSVQVALIALFRSLQLDYLLAARTCPGHSFRNPVETWKAILNLAVGLMSVCFSCCGKLSVSTTSEIRKFADKKAEIQWAEDVRQHPLFLIVPAWKRNDSMRWLWQLIPSWLY
jgi:hypothetical protein